MIRKCFLFSLLFILTSSITVLAQESDRVAYFSPAMRPEFQQDIALFPNAPSYVIDATIHLSDSEVTIDGLLEIDYINRSTDTLNDLVLRLYPNLDSFGGSLTIPSIEVDGNPANPTVDVTGSVLTVPLSTPLAPNGRAHLNLRFQTIVQDGEAPLYNQFSYQNGTLALPNFFPLLSVYESGFGWWQNAAHPQGDAVYSESSFFDVTLTFPQELIVITSGTLIATVLNTDNTRTSHYLAPLMRDFVVMASRNYTTITDSQDGIVIDVHYLPGGEIGAFEAMQYTKDAIHIFNDLFGDYPFAELDIVETYTTAGGIEYPGLIVVQDDSWNQLTAYLQIVVAHEVAHQWWYSLIGNDQTIYPWLDESLAQYALALYFGELYGSTVEANVLQDYQTGWENYLANNDDLPIGDPVISYLDNTYFRIIYQKGPLFFATLADTYGREAFVNALSTYFTTYRYDIVTPAELKTSLELSLNTNLDTFFDEWVNE